MFGKDKLTRPEASLGQNRGNQSRQGKQILKCKKTNKKQNKTKAKTENKGKNPETQETKHWEDFGRLEMRSHEQQDRLAKTEGNIQT